MDTIFDTEKSPNFVCIKCDYKCTKNSDYVKHIKTIKHIKTEKEYKENTTHNQYLCECGKKYSYHSGLWKHKKACNYNINFSPLETNVSPLETNVSPLETNVSPLETNVLPLETNVLPLETNVSPNFDPTIMDKDELIKYLMKENSEFKEMLVEQNKMVMKMCEKSLDTGKTINNTNTNCNNVNNSFNLQFFLNEKCKDAINISDFVDNIKLQLTDLEHFGYTGYVEGVSRILVKNLKDLDTYSRPIHCSDLKREVLYIKDNNQWTKETEDKTVIKNAIKQVANKNIKQITEWANLNPDCKQSDSKKNNQYLNIVMNSMSGGSNEEQVSNISQIVKNIAKVVTIDKP